MHIPLSSCYIIGILSWDLRPVTAITDNSGLFRQDIKMNSSERPVAVALPLPGKTEINNLNWKKLLSEALRKLEIIPDDWTGEIIIGLQNGGIVFVRKSETLK